MSNGKSGLRVLIIEDDDALRDCVSSALDLKGVKTIEAGTGKSGIELFKTEKPDYVFIDINLPDMNGLEIVKDICGQNQSTRVYIMSGDKHACNELKDDKIAGIIKKPLDIFEIFKALNI